MNCETVQRRIDEVASHREISSHLEQCPACNAKAIAQRRLRGAMREMPRRPVPRQLTAALRVLASQERVRSANVGITWGITWIDRIRMACHDLMRPFAVPAVGGLASAVVIFSALMPSLAMPMPEVTNDVPLMLVTEASVKNFPAIGIGESEVVVDVAIDGSGRMVDYTVVRGAGLLKEDSSLKSQLENSLLFTEFVPATRFGGPASGRVRLRIKSSQIFIRG